MRISIQETGGYAGLTRDVATADTTELDDAAARRIEQAVGAAGFFELPGRVGEAVGADLTAYEVTVSDGARQHTVSFVKQDQSPAIAPIREIVEAVRQTA